MTAEPAMVIELKPEEKLESDALTLYEQATTLTISTQEDYAVAGSLAKTLKEMKKNIEDYFAPLKKSTHEAWKAVCAKENEALSPVKEADTIVRRTMGVYLDEQERIRREAEAKARAEAEERARKERERLLAQAVKAEEKGQAEKAEEKFEQAELVYAAPVVVESAIDKTVKVGDAAVTRKTDLQITVTDLKALCAEVAAGRVPVTVIDVKAGPLKQWAKLNQVTTCPGLHIKEVATVAVR